MIVESSAPASSRPNTRPSWLLARVRYQCDLIELCAREVEARGLLTSDVPERATAALRRWADGSDAPGDRASWALKIEKDPNGAAIVDPRTVTGVLTAMVREAVRTRIEGERYARTLDPKEPRPLPFLRNGLRFHPIGCRGLAAASSALSVLKRLGMLDVHALRLVAPPEAITRDDDAQGEEYERLKMYTAIDVLREARRGAQGESIDKQPDEAFVRELCRRYEVSDMLTSEMVRINEAARGVTASVDPPSISA